MSNLAIYRSCRLSQSWPPVAAAALLLFAAAASADDAPLVRHRQTAVHMGVEFEVELYAASDEAAKTAIAAAFARIEELDKRMSDYDPASELSRLSESSTVPPGADTSRPPLTARAIGVSDDLWRVLHYSQELSRASDGAFDVTIGPLTKLWRRARRQRELPATERMAEARAAVGHRFLKLDEAARTAQLLRPNMRLDLGGIAKGFAADEGLATIKKRGVTRALVRASGDIAVGEAPPGQAGWKIAIAPLDPEQEPTRFVRLTNQAISTSGDSRQHLVIDGRRYSHIIDPRTGLGIGGRSSVSVIARTGMEADGLATAVSVQAPDCGLKLVAAREGVELFMVAEDASGKLGEVATPGFEKLEMPK